MNPLLDIKNLSVTVGCQADAKSILKEFITLISDKIKEKNPQKEFHFEV